MPNIALIGRAGSGKSTLTKRISEKFNLVIIDSTALREYITQKLENWEILENTMAHGGIVPPYLQEKALINRMNSNLSSVGFIWDNLYTESIFQLAEKYTPIDIAFHLEIDEKSANTRLFNRGRGDLSPEFMQNRTRDFETNLPILINSLGKRLVTIDATKTQNDIFKTVSNSITTLLT
ncbi:MAG: nucleoside monophosphate kinase [Firmicutes bacterium]|nr:nucleoside monophosphate kinase [Bacillota bacterium]